MGRADGGAGAASGGRPCRDPRRATTMQRHDLACIIYTSGTGGAPRGVRQHHGAIMRNIAGANTVIEQDFFPGEPVGELFLSFLPLSPCL